MPETMEMRKATIILEGDIRARITAYDSIWCVLRYGKARREVTMRRKYMNFKYRRPRPAPVVVEESHAL